MSNDAFVFIAFCVLAFIVVAFVFIGMIPEKKAETKHKKTTKSTEGELYIKVGGKFYKVSEVEPEKKPEKKERVPAAWRW